MSSSVRLVFVSPDNLPEVWPHVSKVLEPAIARGQGRFSKDTIFQDLVDCKKQLWVIWDEKIKGACVTEVQTWPTGLRLCRIVLVAGEDMKSWVHLLHELTDWARGAKCQGFEATGRPGWEGVFKDLPGWKKTSVEFYKDL